MCNLVSSTLVAALNRRQMPCIPGVYANEEAFRMRQAPHNIPTMVIPATLPRFEQSQRWLEVKADAALMSNIAGVLLGQCLGSYPIRLRDHFVHRPDVFLKR
jgi:hypothetical protein